MAWKFVHFVITTILNRSNPGKENIMIHALCPPSSVKGMKDLKRELFTLVAEVPCLKFKNISNQEIMPIMKKYWLKLQQWKSVQKTDDCTIVYLHPEKIEKFEDIEENDRRVLSQYTDRVEKVLVSIKYENWPADEILKAVMPSDVEIPTSYTIAGHIVHLNLRENQLPYKNLIAQVYLDKVRQARTVINKLNSIDSKFRNFSMEILAGDCDTVATVKENNCKFTFDFAKVYWNSRLCTEHAKLLTYMKSGDVLYDVFAGVGPFAVPAARNGITVLANDLNPDSYKWLQHNAVLNKVKGLTCFNRDGREFLREDVKNHLLDRRDRGAGGCEHIVMNLPAAAVEFLDVFSNWMSDEQIALILRNPPLVHLYCFIKANKSEDLQEIAKTLVEQTIKIKFLSKSLKIIHRVRNVAPNKEMMRVSFYLTEEIMGYKLCREPLKKRLKCEDNTQIVDKCGKE